jgi:hypothetical protein
MKRRNCKMKGESLKERIQRLEDIHEIQNLMGRHEYYHSAGMHKEEFEELFAQKTPGISFEAGDVGAFEGIEAVRKSYVEGMDLVAKRNLEEMRKRYPEAKLEEKDRLAGTMVVHTLTTPVIEVAGDGKTAKGVWMSPGHMTGFMADPLKAHWVWEKYGVDFVKEDGKWKFWHFHVYTDFLTPYDKSWVESSMESRPAPGLPPDFPKPNRTSTTPYQKYGPLATPKLEPRPPVPYETFGKTFRY